LRSSDIRQKRLERGRKHVELRKKERLQKIREEKLENEKQKKFRDGKLLALKLKSRELIRSKSSSHNIILEGEGVEIIGSEDTPSKQVIKSKVESHPVHLHHSDIWTEENELLAEDAPKLGTSGTVQDKDSNSKSHVSRLKDIHARIDAGIKRVKPEKVTLQQENNNISSAISKRPVSSKKNNSQSVNLINSSGNVVNNLQNTNNKPNLQRNYVNSNNNTRNLKRNSWNKSNEKMNSKKTQASKDLSKGRSQFKNSYAASSNRPIIHRSKPQHPVIRDQCKRPLLKKKDKNVVDLDVLDILDSNAIRNNKINLPNHNKKKDIDLPKKLSKEIYNVVQQPLNVASQARKNVNAALDVLNEVDRMSGFLKQITEDLELKMPSHMRESIGDELKITSKIMESLRDGKDTDNNLILSLRNSLASKLSEHVFHQSIECAASASLADLRCSSDNSIDKINHCDDDEVNNGGGVNNWVDNEITSSVDNKKSNIDEIFVEEFDNELNDSVLIGDNDDDDDDDEDYVDSEQDDNISGDENDNDYDTESDLGIEEEYELSETAYLTMKNLTQLKEEERQKEDIIEKMASIETINLEKQQKSYKSASSTYSDHEESKINLSRCDENDYKNNMNASKGKKLDNNKELIAKICDQNVIATQGVALQALVDYRDDMEEKIRTIEKNMNLKLHLLKAQRAQSLSKLQQQRLFLRSTNSKSNQSEKEKLILVDELKQQEQDIHDNFSKKLIELEKEKSTMHEKIYQELLVFQKLKSDVDSYESRINGNDIAVSSSVYLSASRNSPVQSSPANSINFISSSRTPTPIPFDSHFIQSTSSIYPIAIKNENDNKSLNEKMKADNNEIEAHNISNNESGNNSLILDLEESIDERIVRIESIKNNIKTV
jgi:hypothetical protein